MTDRQSEVAQLVADGLTDKQIAARLGIGARRVRQIIARLCRLWQLDQSQNARVQIAQRVASPSARLISLK